ncbi:MAG: BatD family protein, partial [Bacteroidales bacterium]|nr:BatD family protein [Bacteroidales bacterium]
KETFTPQNIEFSRENVNGTIYNSAVIRRYMLLPMQEGSVIIDPAEMVCLVRIRTSSGGRSIFDDFFDSYQTIRKRISSAAIKINVSSLPAGAPESFYGGVGEFKVKVEASKDSIASNEAASLKITVSGNGNISMLETPKVDFPSDFEVYDVKTTENIDAGGTSGTKVFEVPFIPRGAGEYTIGPIPYSYYDIKAKKYITVNSEPIKLKVSASSAALDASGPTSAIRQQVRNVGEDIRYIATGKSALKEKDTFFLFSPLFFALTALIVILFFVAVKTSEKLSARRSDIAGTRNRKANKMARERLRQASQYLKGNLSMAYYEELHKAVLGYLSDKLTISSANLSRDNIVESLQQRGVAEDLINSVAGIIDECEAARYSPDATVEKMEELYDNAVATISALEGSIGKRTKKGGKALIFVAMMLSATISLKAADNEQVRNQWESANELYASGDFQQALEQYIAIEQSGLVSPQLYYNIGNAYYRLGNTARSVLYYERALKLDPSYSDAANNLAIVQRSVLDKIELLPEFILSTWVKKLKYSLSSNLWSIIFLLL